MAYTVSTGWRGLLKLGNSYLRFTDESISIPPAVKVLDNVHAGIRTDSIYQYELVIPDGNISFPLISVDTTGFVSSVTDPIKVLMQNAVNVEPYVNDNGNAIIYRGDIVKTVTTPWIKSLSVKGSSGGTIDVTVGLRGIYGSILPGTLPTDAPLLKGRAIMFNELTWTDMPNMLAYAAGGILTDTLLPREFSLDIETGLVDDNSYNPDNPRALRGFAAGKLSIKGSMTFVGGALNAYPLPRGTVDIVGENNFTPWTTSVDFGGLYTVKGGIWTERTMNVPGMTDIVVTELSFQALYSLADAGGDPFSMPIIVTPGGLLA